MKKLYFILLHCTISIALFSCSSGAKKQESVNLFAAVSVSNVVNQMAEDFKKETGISLRLNLASSGILARQIEAGADFDYYISASKEWMNYLDSLQLVNQNKINALAKNQIVAVVPLENTSFKMDSVAQLPELFEGRISIGDPAHVPAGKYAMQILQKYKLDKALQNRYLPAKNVRDALFMVELGETELGLVYASDAFTSNKVRVVYQFPLKDSGEIAYYGAPAVKESKTLEKFRNYLQSEKAKQIWLNNAFKH